MLELSHNDQAFCPCELLHPLFSFQVTKDGHPVIFHDNSIHTEDGVGDCCKHLSTSAQSEGSWPQILAAPLLGTYLCLIGLVLWLGR